MPIPTTTPPGLRPFEAHGLELRLTPSGEGIGDCPLCGGEDKFSANSETGQWQCFSSSCKVTGNVPSFLQRIHHKSLTGKDDYTELVSAKRLLKPSSLAAWGVCKSFITDEWIVPAYNGEGNICQLYRYVYNPSQKRHVFWATPKVSKDDHETVHGLFGGHLFDNNKQDVHLCEGLWDAITEWEVLGHKINILATPGARIFYDTWVPRYFKSRRVSILFDNDHPKVNKETSNIEDGAGYSGMRRTAGILKGMGASQRPESIRYLRWGADGFDPHLPDGHDIRDVLSLPSPQNGTGIVPLGEREQRLTNLLGRLEAVPEAWPAVKLGKEELTPLPCSSWAELLASWEKAMDMTPGLRKGLAVLMACALSTELIGEQIWVRLMGPPSCGKTTLCEAMTLARKYVKAVSTLTGMHSGYRSDEEGEQDHSLIPTIMGKTFIIKDGDTLLKSANRELIMAEFRDIYDGVSRSHYRHGLKRNYEDIRVTIVISGTSNMRELDASECGGRFIDCIVMDKIDIHAERTTLLFLVNKAWQNGRHEVNGKAEKRDDADKIKAKRLTGGYVIHLREKAGKLIKSVDCPNHLGHMICDCGTLVAYMRARPSETQDEVAEREFAARLVIQYSRLSQCLAAATGKLVIDKEVADMVKDISLDTCRGRTLDIARFLYNKGEEGTPFSALLLSRGGKEDDLKEYMRFLKKIEVAESFELKSNPYMQGQLRWRLTPHVRELYSRVVKGSKADI